MVEAPDQERKPGKKRKAHKTSYSKKKKKFDKHGSSSKTSMLEPFPAAPSGASTLTAVPPERPGRVAIAMARADRRVGWRGV